MGSAVNGEKPISEVLLRSFHPMLYQSEISDIILMGSERIHLFDTPLLMSRNMGLAVDQRVAKRIMDILVSGIGIVITSPIMLLIAIAVKSIRPGTGILLPGPSYNWR